MVAQIGLSRQLKSTWRPGVWQVWPAAWVVIGKKSWVRMPDAGAKTLLVALAQGCRCISAGRGRVVADVESALAEAVNVLHAATIIYSDRVDRSDTR